MAGAGAALARSSRSWTVTQLVMYITLGIETIVVTTVLLQSTMTTFARGPVPTRHATVALARDRVPPNLVQLCVNLLDQCGDLLGYCCGRDKSLGEGLYVLVVLVISRQAL